MRALPQLGFIEAVKLASSRIMDFKGRSRRSEFWWWMLIVLIFNWVITSFIADLLISAVLATVIMFFGLAATARRLHDSGKSAWWVYTSYALGIAANLMTALSPTMRKLTEKAMSGTLDDRAIEKLMNDGMEDFMLTSGVSTLFGILALVVIIMCLIDSNLNANKYGESPKYVSE